MFNSNTGHVMTGSDDKVIILVHSYTGIKF